MTTEAAAEIPDPNALAPQAEPTATPVEATQDTAETTEQAHGNKGRQPWYMDRIAQNQRKADEARAEADAALRRAQTAEEMLARATTQEPTTRTAPAPQDFQNAVRAEAQNQRFYEDVARVRDAGLREFPDFAQSIDVLGAVGIGNPVVLADLFGAVDTSEAHIILDKLAKDPERAAAMSKWTHGAASRSLPECQTPPKRAPPSQRPPRRRPRSSPKPRRPPPVLNPPPPAPSTGARTKPMTQHSTLAMTR